MAKLKLNEVDSPQCNSFIAYANSKLENLMFSNLLSTKLDPSSIVVNALHPGWVCILY